MKYHLKPAELTGGKEPQDIGLEHTYVRRVEVNGKAVLEPSEREICLVIIKGQVEFKVADISGSAVLKDMIYVPRTCGVELSGENAVVMCYGAPSDGLNAKPVHLKFSEIDADANRHKVFGKTENGTRRDVWQYIDTNFNCSRLMMGICYGAPGGWTAWPPHEHAEKREEVYIYFDLDNSFAVQCVYDDMDDAYTVAMVREGDLISIPKGYHPNVGCPARGISYVYCMVAKEAGDRNFMDLHIQKDFGDKFE